MSAIKRVGDEAEPGSSKKRKLNFKPPSPAEHFYCDLFKSSSNADEGERQKRQNNIANSCRLTAYDDAYSFYRNISEIVMEEACESIKNVFNTKKRSFSNRHMSMTATTEEIGRQLALCRNSDGNLRNGKMMMIRFSTSNSAQDYFNPGTVFTLQKVGYIGDGDDLGSQILGTVAQTSDSDDEEEEEKGDPPEKNIAPNNARIIRRIWIHPAHSNFLLKSVASGRRQEQISYIFSLETVISYQRIRSTCLDRPSPPFLEHLLRKKDPAIMTSSLSLPGEKSQLYNSTQLNKSQKEALDACIDAICSDCGNLKLIQGPPGCGKTHFLAHLVKALIQNKKRVLICASSNKAVCVALEKCLSLQDRDDQNKVLYDVDNVDDMFRPSCGMFALIGESSKILTHSKDKDTDVNVQAGFEDVTKPIMMPSSASHVLVTSYVKRISSTFLAFANSLTMDNMRSKMSFEKYYTELIKFFDVIFTYSGEMFMKYIYPYHMTLFDLRNLILHAYTEYSKKFIKKFIDRFSFCLKHLADKLVTTEEIELIFPRDCIQNANAVFCTLTYTAHNLVKSNLNNVDVLIVDEAGQASEGEIIVPFACNPLNLILIGDPKQLPPTVISDFLKKNNLGGTSTMERLMIKTEPYFPYWLLNTQYRMHSSIAAFPNRQFYENRIKNGIQNDYRNDPCTELCSYKKKGSFYFIDTSLPNSSSLPNSYKESKPNGTSWRNEYEASFITRFVDFIHFLTWLGLVIINQ